MSEECLGLALEAVSKELADALDRINRLERDVNYAVCELAALIPHPSSPAVYEWPVQNKADAVCLHAAYTALRQLIAEET